MIPVPSLLSLPSLLSFVCLLVVAVGCVTLVLEFLAVRAFGRSEAAGAPAPGSAPGVTVLKPLHGAEPGLEEKPALVRRPGL